MLLDVLFRTSRTADKLSNNQTNWTSVGRGRGMGTTNEHLSEQENTDCNQKLHTSDKSHRGSTHLEGGPENAGYRDFTPPQSQPTRNVFNKSLECDHVGSSKFVEWTATSHSADLSNKITLFRLVHMAQSTWNSNDRMA
jgi:hypothetical protein